MDNGELDESSQAVKKTNLLICFLTNLPETISLENLYLLQDLLEREGCARLQLAVSNYRNTGQVTMRYSVPPDSPVFDKPLDEAFSDIEDVTNIAGFVLGLKKDGDEWARLSSFIEEYVVVAGSVARGSETVETSEMLEQIEDDQIEAVTESDFEPLEPGDAPFVNFADQFPNGSNGVEEDEIEKAHARTHQKEMELRLVNDEIAFLESAIKSSEKRKEELRQEIEIIENKIIKAQNSQDGLKKQLKEKEDALYQLELKAISAEQIAAEKQAEIDRRLRQAETDSQRAEMLSAKAEQLEAEVSERIAEAEARIISSEKESGENGAIILAKEMDRIGISVELREKLRPEVDETVRYQAAIYALSLIRESAMKLTERVRGEVSELEEECRDLDSRRSELKKTRDEISDICETLTADLLQYKATLCNQDEEIRSLTAMTAEKQKVLDEARRQSKELGSRYESSVAEYVEEIAQLENELKKAEEEHKNKKQALASAASEVANVTANLIAAAQDELRQATNRCAEQVASLEMKARQAQESSNRESAKLCLIINQAEENLIAIKQNATSQVHEIQSKAMALADLIGRMQSENRPTLQARIEEMEQFDRFFDLVVGSLKSARYRVSQAREESQDLEKTYESLREMRSKEMSELISRTDSLTQSIDQICSNSKASTPNQESQVELDFLPAKEGE